MPSLSVRLAAHATSESRDAPWLPRRASGWERALLGTAWAARQRWTGDARDLRLVVATDSGDGDSVDRLLACVATDPREVAPTTFLRAVNVIASGYWLTAMAAHQPSTTVGAGQFTLGAGLLEALSQCVAEHAPVLYVFANAEVPLRLERFAGSRRPQALAVVMEPVHRSDKGFVLEVTPQTTSLVAMRDEGTAPLVALLEDAGTPPVALPSGPHLALRMRRLAVCASAPTPVIEKPQYA